VKNRLIATLAMATAVVAASPAVARGEGATCVGNSCDATYLAVTTLGQANSSGGAGVALLGNATGVVAVSVLFGNATAHSYTPVAGVTIPGVAYSTTGHASGDISITVSGTAD
jgi:hypothetical protein